MPMLAIRRIYIAVLAAGAALAFGAPAARASAPFPDLGGPVNLGPIGDNPAVAWGPCGTPTGAEGQGGTGGTAQQACLDAGASYVGWSIGQIATVTAPTIAGAVGTVVVNAGDATVGG
jgi:hypothetical protein